MQFGDSEVVRRKGKIRILKCGARNNRETFCVLGNGDTKYYEQYDDALDEFNLRWMRQKNGE